MSVDLELIQREKLALLESLAEARKQNGLAFYRPHAKQDSFHKAGSFKHRMVRAGNRFGKSEMGCAEDCAWLLGERPWYRQDDPARKAGIPDRPVKGLVITTDWDKVDEVFTTQRGANPGKFWKYLPPGSVKGERRNHSGAIDTIELHNGSIIRFDTVKSFMSNPQGSESSDYDFIHVDEPCPKKMYDAAARGLLDRGGSDWFTLTPLSEFWINDMFFPQRQKGVSANSYTGLANNIWSTTGTMEDNPLLTLENIEDFLRNIDADEREARRNGIPLHLSGLVYKEFIYDKHVLKALPNGWKAFHKPPANYTVYESIDTHPRTPHAILFCAVSPAGQLFFFDEVWNTSTNSIPTLADTIKSIDSDYFVANRKIEPAAYIEDPITNSCIATELEMQGIYVERASKSREHGTLNVKQQLSLDNNIYVSPNCVQFLWEISRYHWDEKDSRRANKPVDKDDHFMECFYRMLIDQPVYIDVEKPSDIPNELDIVHGVGDPDELETNLWDL